MTPSQLTTPRLILRRTRDGDAINLFRNYCSDLMCSQFLTRKPHNDIEQTQCFLDQWCDFPWEHDAENFAWVIALSSSDEAIGVFIVTQDADTAEIHFGINRQYWRHGLMTEAGSAVTEWLMSQAGLTKVSTVCDVENQGAIGVLEKLGFQKEGILQNYLLLPAFGDSARDGCLYTLPVNTTVR